MRLSEAVNIVLTPRGVSVVRAASVLVPERLEVARSRPTTRERDAAIKGLVRLAEACRDIAVRVDR